jgi:hypothetical protein
MGQIPVPPFGNSSERPDNLPQEVLWKFSDCKSDPTAGMKAPNPSRPNMRNAVRTTDGLTVDQSVYDLIRSSAQSIATAILQPLKPQNFQKGKGFVRYLQTNHAPVWMNAVLQLEKQQPLLALCADHWKAKHILQGVLRNKKDGDTGDDENGSGSGGEQSNKRSRAPSNATSPGKRIKAAKLPGHRKSISRV